MTTSIYIYIYTQKLNKNCFIDFIKQKDEEMQLMGKTHDQPEQVRMGRWLVRTIDRRDTSPRMKVNTGKPLPYN